MARFSTSQPCDETFENDRRNRNLCLTCACHRCKLGYGRQPCADVPYPNDRCHQPLHAAFSIASFHPSLCFVKREIFFCFFLLVRLIAVFVSYRFELGSIRGVTGSRQCWWVFSSPRIYELWFLSFNFWYFNSFFFFINYFGIDMLKLEIIIFELY